MSETMNARRRALGLTLRELSRRSGVAVSYLSDLESGKKPIDGVTLAVLRKIAVALHVTVGHLAAPTSDPRAAPPVYAAWIFLLEQADGSAKLVRRDDEGHDVASLRIPGVERESVAALLCWQPGEETTS